MEDIRVNPSPVQIINDDRLNEMKISLFIKRDDLIHPEISGNKYRKIKYNLQKAGQLRHDTILTFGGAFSNHLHAVAAVGLHYGFQTIGFVRGEKHEPLNPTLQFAVDKKMQLQFISRTAYREKYEKDFIIDLEKKFGRFYLLPEGGTNTEAVKGCTEIIDEIKIDFDVIACSCGTGGTLAGLISGLDGHRYAIGFPALKGGEYLKNEVVHLTRNYNDKIYLNWHLETDYHFGGFARYTLSLIDFINSFKEKHKIQLDPIYTGKMMYGLFDLIKKGYFKSNTRILVLHTGGLQGIEGFNERFGKLIK